MSRHAAARASRARASPSRAWKTSAFTRAGATPSTSAMSRWEWPPSSKSTSATRWSSGRRCRSSTRSPDVGAALHRGVAVLGGRDGAADGVEVDDDAARAEQRQAAVARDRVQPRLQARRRLTRHAGCCRPARSSVEGRPRPRRGCPGAGGRTPAARVRNGRRSASNAASSPSATRRASCASVQSVGRRVLRGRRTADRTAATAKRPSIRLSGASVGISPAPAIERADAAKPSARMWGTAARGLRTGRFGGTLARGRHIRVHRPSQARSG